MKETDDRYYMGKGADGLVSAAGKGASLAGKISPRSIQGVDFRDYAAADKD